MWLSFLKKCQTLYGILTWVPKINFINILLPWWLETAQMKSQAGLRLSKGSGEEGCALLYLFGITSTSWSLGLSIQDRSAFPLAMYSQGKAKEGACRQLFLSCVFLCGIKGWQSIACLAVWVHSKNQLISKTQKPPNPQLWGSVCVPVTPQLQKPLQNLQIPSSSSVLTCELFLYCKDSFPHF